MKKPLIWVEELFIMLPTVMLCPVVITTVSFLEGDLDVVYLIKPEGWTHISTIDVKDLHEIYGHLDVCTKNKTTTHQPTCYHHESTY